MNLIIIQPMDTNGNLKNENLTKLKISAIIILQSEMRINFLIWEIHSTGGGLLLSFLSTTTLPYKRGIM